MKLEDKFFHSFFYPFLVGVVLNMIIVTIFLYIFTNNYLDKTTAQNIVDLEKKNARTIINSVNALITTSLLKVQASLNEQILFYQKMARLKEYINDYKLKESLMVSTLKLEEININDESNKYKGIWFVSPKVTNENLQEHESINLQLIIFSNILVNVCSSLESTKSIVPSLSFFFEDTELLIMFPLYYYLKSGESNNFKRGAKNPSWCLQPNGRPFYSYKFKCGDVYNNIIKAKNGVFDVNGLDLKDRTIYVSNSFTKNDKTFFNVFIEFNDPITGGSAFSFLLFSQNYY